MNYRHIYHAGNFSDVLKHTTLMMLLDSLSLKEKPWFYLESHAGSGRYNLFSAEANKTLEYKNGVEKLINAQVEHPLLKNYLALLNNFGYPHYYPGSPLFAYQALREQDRMVMIEKHPEEVSTLKKVFMEEVSHLSSRKQLSIHCQDGYQGLKAFLPPKEHRGLILIDPPFEQENEWQQIIDALHRGLERFSQGIYAVWYPIKDKRAIKAFHQALLHLECKQVLLAELCIYPEDVSEGLKGAGMAIVNPPWQIDEKLNALLPEIYKILSIQDQGRFEVKYLKRE